VGGKEGEREGVRMGEGEEGGEGEEMEERTGEGRKGRERKRTEKRRRRKGERWREEEEEKEEEEKEDMVVWEGGRKKRERRSTRSGRQEFTSQVFVVLAEEKTVDGQPLHTGVGTLHRQHSIVSISFVEIAVVHSALS